ncbi:sodium- and chloride-dependent GABA transporter 1-like protein [Aphelenchoides avenae]|nr:sodium- and chloride-dependent GABA transporter 1-like protein [Aphelenchus avenae]
MSSKTWGAVPTAAHYFNVVKLGLPSLVIFLIVTLRVVSDGSTRLFRFRFWRSWKCRRSICLAILTVLSVGCSVVLISPSSVLLARLLDKYTGIALLFIAFSEVVAIIHCHGFKRYISNIYTMLGMPLSAWQVHTFAGLYYFVSPAFLIIALILQFVFHKPTVVQLYIFPAYFDGFGWFIAATCMILIPIGWLRKMIPTVVCKLPTTDLYEPTGNWGPVARKNREVSRHNERAFRAKH